MTENNFNNQDFNAFNGNEYQGAHAVKVDHKKASKNRSFLYGVAGAALACVVGLGGLGVSQATADTEEGSQVQATIQLGAESTPIEGVQKSEDPTLAEAVAAKCLPSIVAIDVYMDTNSMMGDGYYMYGYGAESSMNNGEPNYQKAGLGSGVVMTEDGYIITNNHVVEDAGMLKVTIEGQEYDAEVIGTDPSSDVAVIKAIDASGLTPIELGDSDDLTIGEWVMTLGSPYGYEQSVATGIVSATSRSQIMNSSTNYYGAGERTIYPNMIQTDAAINPGNSGGALVDSDGALIGINTMITSASGSYSGVGFAIPVNYAVSIAQQIIDGQAPTHAQLGVSLSTINSAAAERYGFPVDEGAYVAAVVPGSGAEAAGLVEGDIVTSFDGQDVESADDLTLDVRSKQPGDVVTLTVISNGETRDVEVTLGSDGNDQSAAQTEESEEEAPEVVEPEQVPENNGEAEVPQQDQRPDQGQNPNGDEDGYGDDYGYGYGNPYGYGLGNGDGYGYGNGGSILDELLDLLQRR